MLPIYFSDMTYLTHISESPCHTPKPRCQRSCASAIVLFALTTLCSSGLIFAETAPGTQEAAWSEILTKSVDSNKINWLNTPDEKFIALYRDDTTGTLQGGVILLHDMGTHPDWPDVIAPLRQSLPQHGWATLSIQLPVFDKDGQVSNYAGTLASVSARIRAAIKHFRDLGNSNIVLLGHGLGAAMGAAFLTSNENNGVAAFVGISMPTYQDGEEWMDLLKSIEKFNLPMLDVYGSNDFTSVTQNADKRAQAARRGGLRATRTKQLTGFNRSATAKGAFSKEGGFITYRKFQIVGANHSFRGHEHTLSKRIAGWLKHHAGGVSIQQ